MSLVYHKYDVDVATLQDLHSARTLRFCLQCLLKQACEQLLEDQGRDSGGG